MESLEVKQRWQEYITELFDDDRNSFVMSEEKEFNGPPIMESEVEDAIKNMRHGKAIGEDGIAIEMIKTLEEWGVKIVTELANSIYDSGQIPDAMSRSIFITLPKKPGAIECKKFRTISIMSQLSKVVLRVILNRIKNKVKSEIGEEQFGFMKGKGTTNAVFVVRMLGERAIEMQKDLFMCFIDYEKAFDTVKHRDLLSLLSNIDY